MLEEVLRGGIDASLDLLRSLGIAFFLVSQYRCDESLDALEALSETHPPQASTGWALHVKGTCHFERAKYVDMQRAHCVTQ